MLKPSRRSVIASGLSALTLSSGAVTASSTAFAQSDVTNKTELRIGHINDVTALPLFVCRSRELFDDQGLSVRLRSFRSFDEMEADLIEGDIDAAIMPPSAAIRSAFEPERLGRSQLIVPAITQMGGTALTVTVDLYDKLVDANRAAMAAPRPTKADAIAAYFQAGGRKLRFGITRRYSMDEYKLRYWLAASGIDPDTMVEFVEQSGPFLVASLRARAIDGFFAPEPWSGHAVSGEFGRTLITGQELWANAPAAALVVTVGWVEQNPETLSKLIRSLLTAGAWLDQFENRARAIELISRESTLNLPQTIGLSILNEGYRYIRELGVEPFPDYAIFHRYACHFPWLSDALWVLTQMVRWGQIVQPLDLRRVAQSVFRPDLYRLAVEGLDEPTPRQDYRVEGTHFSAHVVADGGDRYVMGPDAYFDGGLFNPGRISDYLNGFDVSDIRLNLTEFSELNG